MADTQTQDPGKGQEAAPDQAPAPAQPQQVTFTEDQQRALDEIIGKRIGEVRAKHEAEVRALKESHAKALQRAQMDEEARLKAEQEDAIQYLTRRVEDAERGLRLATAQRAVVEAGLPAEIAGTLMGADDEATARNIAAVRKAVDERASALYAERVAKGVPRAPAQGAAGWETELRSAMGLPPKGKERRENGSRKLQRRHQPGQLPGGAHQARDRLPRRGGRSVREDRGPRGQPVPREGRGHREHRQGRDHHHGRPRHLLQEGRVPHRVRQPHLADHGAGIRQGQAVQPGRRRPRDQGRRHDSGLHHGRVRQAEGRPRDRHGQDREGRPGRGLRVPDHLRVHRLRGQHRRRHHRRHRHRQGRGAVRRGHRGLRRQGAQAVHLQVQRGLQDRGPEERRGGAVHRRQRDRRGEDSLLPLGLHEER
ncbi:MAG: DUF4355 domain-containing protein, partial [Candidatus Methanomethylophilaceae archaeon]|nr:DUF4355 domain-containing protein [Candidatus Methanomethylophilaceae archaeon]